MNKKILVVVNNVWPPPVLITGISIIYECQKELSKLGYEVHILTSTGLWDKNSQKSKLDEMYDVKEWFKQENIDYKIIFHSYDMSMFNRIPRIGFYLNRLIPLFFVPILVWKNKIDIIHEYTSTPLLIYRSWFFKKVLKTRVYHTIIAEIPGFFSSTNRISHFKTKIDGVICTSKKIEQNFIEIGYPKELLNYISVGVNNNKFINIPNKSETKKRYNIDEHDFTFTFLAPLENHKGPKLFANAALKFINDVGSSKVKFIIATYDSPSTIPYVKRRSEILQIIKNDYDSFLFLEGIHNIKEIMSITSALVLPLTTIDGATSHPVTLLEGMASKRLVIASDLPGNKELVTHNKNGLLFKVNNTMSLVENMKYAYHNTNNDKLSSNALETIKDKYSIQSVANSLDILYDS